MTNSPTMYLYHQERHRFQGLEIAQKAGSYLQAEEGGIVGNVQY